MPEIITMDGKWACRIAPYDQVRVICVDGPEPHPVAFYDAEGGLDGCNAYGKHADTNYDLVPLQVRRQPVEAWAVKEPTGLTTLFCQLSAAKGWQRNYGGTIVRLVEAEGAP